VLSEADSRTHGQVHRWLRDYVGKPHEGVGRAGPVCPFVPAAMKDEAIRVMVGHAGTEPDDDSVTDVLRAAVKTFGEVAWRGAKPLLHSLVVVLPDLREPDQWSSLDRAHARVKSDVVSWGLMIGQFHPRCPEPAVRNKNFMVNRSPLALVVIRNMALHDVLFLSERREWFAEYDARFGHRYGANANVDPLFASEYERAAEAFGR
jgi:heptaprenyl diphosphate synthase